MNPKRTINDMTIEELQALVRETVQEAMAEVLIEFAVAAEHDAQLVYQAELTDLLRSSLEDRLPDYLPTTSRLAQVDD
jgi:L-aminopeptidase/D-esterase-like protein